MTTAARGTFCIMRCLPRSTRICRSLARTCGSPSICLNSSRNSLTVMRCFSHQVCFCQAKSSAAITVNTATTPIMTCTAMVCVTVISAVGSSPMIASSLSLLGQMMTMITNDTIASLAMLFAKFTTLVFENSRLKPASGETLESLGVTGSRENSILC
ncbi:hypothetical protein BMS3Bbin10_01108 [bacterium BMS3Bbin10]|nr:hypothetical protein BMS3Bbin10_01108 [bacterium BMS3Bbin10]